jgi:hypothetical protein
MCLLYLGGLLALAGIALGLERLVGWEPVALFFGGGFLILIGAICIARVNDGSWTSDDLFQAIGILVLLGFVGFAIWATVAGVVGPPGRAG